MLRFEKKSIWYRLTTLIHHEFNPFFLLSFTSYPSKFFPFACTHEGLLTSCICGRRKGEAVLNTSLIFCKADLTHSVWWADNGCRGEEFHLAFICGL